MSRWLRTVIALLLLLWILDGARCGTGGASRPRPRDGGTTMGCIGRDRYGELRRILRCDGKTDDASRKLCFVQALRHLRDWPVLQGREGAIEEAERVLASWPAHQREARSILFTREGGRPLQRDLLRLVRYVYDHFRDDWDEDASGPARVIFASPGARGLESYEAVRSDLPLGALRRGPGASGLRRFVLRDCYPLAEDWAELYEWPGLRTLEEFRVRGAMWKSVESRALWGVLARATALRTLGVHVDGDVAVHRLEFAPELSHRLRALDLSGSHLREWSVDALERNTALDHLETLDLRGNGSIAASAQRLRRAPQFARTRVLTDASAPAP